jgi:hypothetical protein
LPAAGNVAPIGGVKVTSESGWFAARPCAARNSRDGDTIASEPPLDISDLIETSSEVLDSAKNAMQNVESITAKIDQGEGTIGSLINDKRMYNQATAATAQAQAGAMAFDENMQALSHNFLLEGFFNRRGYENSADLTKHAITRLPAGPVHQKVRLCRGQRLRQEEHGEAPE